MNYDPPLDCIVIGYYEPPFEEYEALIRSCGEQSAAYKDLQFSFVRIGERNLNYVDLLNKAYEMAHPDEKHRRPGRDIFLSGDIPNLAAVYLSNYLRKRGLQVEYINLFQYEKHLLAEYLASNPTCVAITTTFYVLSFPVSEIVAFIREHNPNVKIIIGGPLIANYFRSHLVMPQDAKSNLANIRPSDDLDDDIIRYILEDMGGDIYVVESQGEQSLARLIACLKENVSLSTVPNIAYFEGSDLHITERKAENNSLDDNIILWNELPAERLGNTIQTRTARSCAFNCSFCNYPTRAGKLSFASLEAIRKELDSIHEVPQIKNVVFIDDTFNVPLGRFKDICRLIIDRGYNFNWFSYFRCSNSDAEAVELMAKSGCKGVFLGIESGSPRILENMNKAATIEKYSDGIRLLRENNILTFASFIAGFPGETDETIRETIDFIKTNRPDFYRVQLWYCEPGTPIERRRENHKIEGEGFAWSHATMNSKEAATFIDEMCLNVTESIWLPQWSFDFWIIPYLLGRGIPLDGFKEFMLAANRLLALEIAQVPEVEKTSRQEEALDSIVTAAAKWTLVV
jgi:radical SAM PhpK family P-methyltransferase